MKLVPGWAQMSLRAITLGKQSIRLANRRIRNKLQRSLRGRESDEEVVDRSVRMLPKSLLVGV
jgi:hypothetical protein